MRPLFRFGLGFPLLLTACVQPDLGQACAVSPGASAAERNEELSRCLKTADEVIVTRRDLDVLFMIDNSPSMSPKQKALAQNIPRFIEKIDATGANYHVGIVTSDVGTLPASGIPFPASGSSACASVTGDDGQLQTRPCTARSGMAEFTAACNTLCPDPSFALQNGQQFISKDAGVINVKSKKDAMGVEIGPALAFQCMALVGENGCGVEGQLEAVKRALDDKRNPGFLRANSVLGVIFITDEDDCSVQLAQRTNTNPADASCSATEDPDYNCFNLDYRCLAKSIQCDQPLSTTGAKTGCRERPSNWLEPINNYVHFISTLKPADRLVLAGIWSPSMLDHQAGSSPDGQLIVASESASTATNLLIRGQKNEAACFNPDPSLTSSPNGFFGQAQLRLSTFIRRFAPEVYVEKSICDAASYPATLDRIADLLIKKPICLSGRPTQLDGAPACLVGYVDANQPNGLPDTYLPQCSASCCHAWATAAQPSTDDPTIQSACAAEQQDCFCAEPHPTSCTDTAVAGVWRKDNAAPPSGKVINFRCAGTRSPSAPTQ